MVNLYERNVAGPGLEPATPGLKSSYKSDMLLTALSGPEYLYYESFKLSSPKCKKWQGILSIEGIRFCTFTHTFSAHFFFVGIKVDIIIVFLSIAIFCRIWFIRWTCLWNSKDRKGGYLVIIKGYFSIFFHKNLCCWYSLESPQQGFYGESINYH